MKKLSLNNMLFQLFFVSNVLLWPISFNYYFNLRLNILILLILGIYYLISKNRISLFAKKNTLIYSSFIYLHAFFTAFMYCENIEVKSIITIMLASILLLACFETGFKSNIGDWKRLEKTCVVISIIILIFFLLQHIFPNINPKNKVYMIGNVHSAFFDEPSHLAFSIFPCVAIMMFSTNDYIKKFSMVFSGILLILSPSTTMIVLLIIIIFLFFLKNKRNDNLILSFILLITIPLIIFFNFTDIENLIIKISSVINFESIIFDQTNITSIVYIQGLIDAFKNLINTYGYGLGINNMGCSPLPENIAREILINQNIYDLNRYDGSFLASKIISEFGVFGLLFLFLIFIKTIIFIYNNNESNTMIKISKLLIVCFFFICITRSSGYFTGSFLIFLLAISKNNLFKFKDI